MCIIMLLFRYLLIVWAIATGMEIMTMPLLVEGVACMASCAIYAYAKQFSLSVYYSHTIFTIFHSTCTCIGIFLPFLVSLRWDDRLLLCGEVFAEVVHSWRDRWQQPFCDWRRQISLSR